MNDLLQKLRIYGLKRFVIFSLMRIYRKLWLELVLKTYSQRNEDHVIFKILKNKNKGFYVDIGAYDPITFSNTKLFYDMGWNGINIEPDPVNFQKFVDKRKRDLNLNLGIGNKSGNLTFYQFVPSTLSTFSKKESQKYLKMGYLNVSKNDIKIEPLPSVFKKHLRNSIDFISIDTEGYNLEVLKSNNWNLFRPKVICIESVEHKVVGSGKDTNLESFLNKVGYNRYLDNGINSIYIDKNFKYE